MRGAGHEPAHAAQGRPSNRPALATAGNGALAAADPINHAMSRTDIALMAAPQPSHIHDRGRAPGQPRPQGQRQPARRQLPGQRDQEDHDDGHQRLLGRAAHRGLRDARGKQRTGRRPAQESDDAQRANDETLPVTIHGERGREHHQDHIEQVTWHPLTL